MDYRRGAQFVTRQRHRSAPVAGGATSGAASLASHHPGRAGGGSGRHG